MKKGWTTIPLGNLCRIEIGGTPARKNPKLWDSDKKTDNVWLSIADLPKTLNAHVTDSKEYISDDALKKAKLVREGTLLVSFKLTLGRLAYAGRDLCTNEAIAALTILDDRVIAYAYLYWYLTYFDWQKAAEGDHKIKGKTLNKAKLKVLPVLAPPLPEQERIVAILDEAFATIATVTANAEKNLANARELFESELNRIFSQKRDGWVETTLGEVAAHGCSLSYGIVQPGKDVPAGLPVVRPTDMVSKLVQLNGLKCIDPSRAESYKRTTLLGGDLLLCVRGSTGAVSVASKELAGGNVTRGIVPIWFDRKLIKQEFGYYLLVSPEMQHQIKAKTYGAALMQINIRDVRQLTLCYPGLRTQSKLCQLLDNLSQSCADLAAAQTTKLASLTELKKSILQRAFTGELTSNANVSDYILSEAEL